MKDLCATLLAAFIIAAFLLVPWDFPSEQDAFKGEVIYKGAYTTYSMIAGYQDVYYITVQSDKEGTKTFYIPGILWASLKDGATWEYVPPVKNDDTP